MGTQEKSPCVNEKVDSQLALVFQLHDEIALVHYCEHHINSPINSINILLPLVRENFQGIRHFGKQQNNS